MRVFVMDRQSKLAYRPDGGVAKAIERYAKVWVGDMPVAMNALASALIGLSRVAMEV